LVQLAAEYLRPRDNRHVVIIRPGFPEDYPWNALLDQWVHEYLVARRRFYDTRPGNVADRLLALWKRNESVDWQSRGGWLRMVDVLKLRNIEPMVEIRVVVIHGGVINFLIWNADRRSARGKIHVNAFGTISGYFEKLYSDDR
jgi:hypothetical protein